MIINYAYIKSLPLEFFYFEQVWAYVLEAKGA